jgi:hypothetical protein
MAKVNTSPNPDTNRTPAIEQAEVGLKPGTNEGLYAGGPKGLATQTPPAVKVK